MIQDLINNYNDLGDSIIKNVKYDLEKKVLVVIISVLNIRENYKWDLVQINFIDVIEYRFVQNERVSNSVVMNAYISEGDGQIVLDFFPTENEKNISFNENSDFMIKCKEINFIII